MIAGIDNQVDIDLFLEAEELEKLSAKTIEGILIKVLKPKRQGTISVSVNDSRRNEQGFGIGIDDSKYWGVKDGFHVDVFVGSEEYQIIRERGRLGIRQRMLDGSKIHIYDRSRLDGIDKIGVGTLEFYRDNKDKLLEEFG